MRKSDVFESKYLKSAEIPEATFVPLVIRECVLENLAQEGKPAENKPVLYFVNKQKGMILNAGNWDILETAYGDSDDWGNKPVSVYITPTTMPNGTPCMGLRLSIAKQKPIKGAGKPKPAPLPPQPAYEGEPGESAGPGTPDDNDIPFAANKY